MPKLVVDASVILKWVLPGEPYEENAVRLKDDHVSRLVEICAPSLAVFEVANIILKACKLEKMPPSEAERAIKALEKLRITLIYPAGWLEMPETIDIARRSNTTVYDVSYVYLAKKLGASLVTVDEEIVRKASGETKTLHLKDY